MAMQTKLYPGSLFTLALLNLLTFSATPQEEAGFTSLFDGQSLQGWTLIGKRGDGYGVKDGVIYCARGGGGNLLTEREFSDFVLRFEFKLEEGSNNGVGIRAPLTTAVSTLGMEIQILDEGAALAGKYGKLRDTQFHGSVYDVIPAKKGALKTPGQWNTRGNHGGGAAHQGRGKRPDDSRCQPQQRHQSADPGKASRHLPGSRAYRFFGAQRLSRVPQHPD